MRDHPIYILYSLSSKDSQRTLRKSSVRPVVSLSHAPKLALRRFNSINPAKIVTKCPGTERFSQISRIPRAKRESEKFSGLSRNRPPDRKTQVNRLTWKILIHPVHILIHPYCQCIFTLLTTSVDNKVAIIVIMFNFFCNLTFQVFTTAGV